MILSGTTPRALTWRGCLTVLGLSALLPLVPTWVRAQPPEGEKKVIEFRVADVKLDPAVKTENPKVQSETQKLEAELKQKVAEIHLLELRLREAQLRTLKELEPLKEAEGKARVVRMLGDGAGNGVVGLWKVQPGGDGKNIIVFSERVQDPAKPGAAPKAAPFEKGTLYELIHGEKGTLILRPVAPAKAAPVEGTMKIHIEGFDPFKVEPVKLKVPEVAKPPLVIRTTTSSEAHARDLEKRLDDIMRELEQLKKEMKGTRAAPPSPKEPATKARPGEQSKLEPGKPGTVILLDDKSGEIKLRFDGNESYLKALEQLKRAQEELERAAKTAPKGK